MHGNKLKRLFYLNTFKQFASFFIFTMKIVFHFFYHFRWVVCLLQLPVIVFLPALLGLNMMLFYTIFPIFSLFNLKTLFNLLDNLIFRLQLIKQRNFQIYPNYSIIKKLLSLYSLCNLYVFYVGQQGTAFIKESTQIYSNCTKELDIELIIWTLVLYCFRELLGRELGTIGKLRHWSRFRLQIDSFVVL